MNRISVATAAALIAGCATYAPGDKNVEAVLKKFQPIPDKVSLYACYEKRFSGAKPRVWIDNTNFGALKTNSFIHAALAPGKHSIRVYKDGVLGGGFSGEEVFTASAGQIVIFWVGVTGNGFGTMTVDSFNSEREARDCVSAADYAVRAPD